MLEAQAQVAAWVTEQKHIADTVALNGQHVHAKDKGARRAPPVEAYLEAQRAVRQLIGRLDAAGEGFAPSMQAGPAAQAAA